MARPPVRERALLIGAFVIASSVGSAALAQGKVATEAGWKAGTARVAITPRTPIWMAGYAARTKPSEGAVHDLWAKALALQNPAGTQVVLVTLDVCGIDRELSNQTRDRIGSRHQLARSQIVLACSHTHSGPVVGRNLHTMYDLDANQRRLVAEFTKFLEDTIVQVAGQAIERLVGARLGWGIGHSDIAVNRRANKEAEVPALRGALKLQGPVDHDVPVLRIDRLDGPLMATVFGYACHCTVLDGYQLSGDYAGFAQDELEARHPGAQAMFVAGCGGDQNPIPRRDLDLAVRYGKSLADSVGRAVAGPLEPISGKLSATYEEIALAFGRLPTRAEIEVSVKSTNIYEASRARHLLKIIEMRGSLEATYPYPIQAWRLGGLTWIFLGGEVVVDYALRLKRNLGSAQTWVSAYCNDVMAYIPSKRVLKEGGYEGGGAMLYYGLPSPWSDDVEDAITAALARQIRELGQQVRPGLRR
jgi:neutral ceramidase